MESISKYYTTGIYGKYDNVKVTGPVSCGEYQQTVYNVSRRCMTADFSVLEMVSVQSAREDSVLSKKKQTNKNGQGKYLHEFVLLINILFSTLPQSFIETWT